MLKSGYPVNALIADETGLGKTIVVGLYLFSLVLRGLVRNILVTAPKSLLGQWHDELLYKFGLYFRIVTSGRELKELLENLRPDSELRLIVSIDLVKGKYGIKFLQETPDRSIDVAIIDEAHHVITRKDTLRLEAAKYISKKTKSLILVSATPFRGYYDVDYERVIDLLGKGFLYIRRFKDQVVDLKGNYIFPPRESFRVKLTPNPRWRGVYDTISSLIDDTPLKPITKIVLKKRAASSLSSLQLTIEKIRTRKIFEDPFTEETDDVFGLEPDIYDIKTGAHSKKIPYTNLSKILDITRKVMSENRSFKEIEFLRLLRPLIKKDKVVIFTEYKSTLDHLGNILMKEDVNFVSIHGGMGVKERRKTMEVFWRDEKVKVLLATDAAGEGINLHIAPYQINYDIPWSPLKLEQRFGRIHRYGQRRPTYVYNLAIAGTIDEKISDRILEKIRNIAKLLGDWVYDYIGMAIRPSEVKELVLTNGIGPDEKTIVQRLKKVKEELHNPPYDNFNELLNELEVIRANICKWLNIKAVQEINILETIRISKEVIRRIKTKKVQEFAEHGLMTFCTGHEQSALFWILVKSNGAYLDPLTGAQVEEKHAHQYLEDKIRELANFYGFECNSIDYVGDV